MICRRAGTWYAGGLCASWTGTTRTGSAARDSTPSTTSSCSAEAATISLTCGGWPGDHRRLLLGDTYTMLSFIHHGCVYVSVAAPPHGWARRTSLPVRMTVFMEWLGVLRTPRYTVRSPSTEGSYSIMSPPLRSTRSFYSCVALHLINVLHHVVSIVWMIEIEENLENYFWSIVQ